MPTVHCDCIENIFWNCHEQPFDVLSLRSEIDIWKIRISSNLDLIGRFNRILPEEEHTKASRYHHQKDRDRVLISRIALRLLLAKYLNASPSEIKIMIGSNKKPYLRNAKNFFYNASHSGDFILIAFSNFEVGVDIEEVDENFSYGEILERYFSNQEIEFIGKSQKSSENFYLLWTRKEALLKATSKGIHDDLKLVPATNGMHISDGQMIGSADSWQVKSFKLHEQYIASVASPAYGQILTFFDFDAKSF